MTALRSLDRLLRRRVPLLLILGLLGLLAGTGYAVRQPPLLASTTLVLLPTPTPAQAAASSDTSTQVRIALSATLLAKAGTALRPPLSSRAVEALVDVSAPTNQIIQIQAFSVRGGEAQVLSQSLANAFVDYVNATANTVATAALGGLRSRQATLQNQFSQLQDEIAASTLRLRAERSSVSAAAVRDGQLLAQLKAQQAEIALQLDKVKEQVATSAPVGAAYGAGTTVIQAATAPVAQPLVRRLLVWPPLGFVLGVVLGVAVLARRRGDPRMRSRDELADAVGRPVLGAVTSRPQRSVSGWSALLQTYQASAVDAWAFRQVLRALVPVEARHPGTVDHPQSITVVTLSGDRRALALAPQLAAFAASLGIVTRLVCSAHDQPDDAQLRPARHPSAAALWAVFSADRPSDPRPGLLLGDERPQEPVELTVAVAVVDRRWPTVKDHLDTGSTVLAIAPATATAEELARLLLAIDDVGRRIDGIVVADPEPSDGSTGRHPLDERVRQVPLPIRLTGNGAVGMRSVGRS